MLWVVYWPFQYTPKYCSAELLGNSDGLSERNFCQIVGVHAGDVRLLGQGDRLLGLDDLEVVRNPREEAVLGLLQCLAGKINIALGDSDQIG